MPQRQITPEEFSRQGADFMLTEISLAMTFLDLSEAARSREHQQAARNDALTAYRTVLRFFPRLSCSPEVSSRITRELEALRLRLVHGGVL